MFIRVKEFHRAFGQLISSDPQLPEQAVRDLRISLIREELNEYFAAFHDNDRIEMADALGDLLYVLAGTAISYGIDDPEPFEPKWQPLDEPDDGLYSLEMLTNSFDNYLLAESTNDMLDIKCAIYFMINDVVDVARQTNIPINAIFDEIHRSNMSKLQADGTALRRDDGKVLKPESWSPPDIAGVLAAYG